jgi:integrase/recombinase XerD
MRKLPPEKRAPAVVFGDAADAVGMTALCGAYLDWCRAREYSALTIDQHRRYLNAFLRWSADRRLTQPGQVTREALASYHQSMLRHRKADGKPLAARTRKCYLSPIRSWFRWLERAGHVASDPAAGMELPKVGWVLPRDILTAAEVESVLREPDVSDPLGLRDRAILETIYSTAMRRAELAALARSDLDRGRRTVHIRGGKGRKDRVIPVGSRALDWLGRYEREVRPGLVRAGPGCEKLFLTHHGEGFTPYRLSQLVTDYVAAAELGKRGSCHLFRHTAATLMLENGCDIRFLQALLGHASLSTTQIYTHVSVTRLADAHRATHPAECCRRPSRRG